MSTCVDFQDILFLFFCFCLTGCCVTASIKIAQRPVGGFAIYRNLISLRPQPSIQGTCQHGKRQKTTFEVRDITTQRRSPVAHCCEMLRAILLWIVDLFDPVKHGCLYQVHFTCRNVMSPVAISLKKHVLSCTARTPAPCKTCVSLAGKSGNSCSDRHCTVCRGAFCLYVLQPRLGLFCLSSDEFFRTLNILVSFSRSCVLQSR